MRTKNSLKNIAAALLLSTVAIVLGLVSQKVFIDTLGLEYLGLNSLFTSLISALGIVELGLGSAIVYHLYEPLANGDKPRIKTMIEFYKKGYRVIAAVVTLLGLLLVPFLGPIVGHVTIRDNIYVIFALFLIDIICTYLLAYKRSMLYADEKNHVISTIHIVYLVAVNVAQITLLLATKNFYLYLIAKIVVHVVENIATTLIVNRRYPYLGQGSAVPIDSETKKDVFQKLRALFLHKTAEFAIFGTDNIIISLFLGLSAVGLVSNYLLVVSAITGIVWQMFASITASLGNLLVTSDQNGAFAVYRRIRFANIWIGVVASVGLFVAMDQFIRVWLGGGFVLSIGILAALCINLYLQLTRSAINGFKEAAGIFYQDRYMPIAESIINIVFSLIFLQFFGIAGVFMGTICSNLLLHLYSYPKYVYTQLFGHSYREYYREFAGSLCLALAVGAIAFVVSRTITVENSLLQLSLQIIVSLVVSNGLLYAALRSTAEFHYYQKLLQQSLGKLKRTALLRLQKLAIRPTL